MQQLMFKLDRNPKGRGLRCEEGGLFLGRDALLRRDAAGGFAPRPDDELRTSFNHVYGAGADWDSRIRSVELVANALNKGDMARAMMTAVLMRLPDPDGPIGIADVDGVLAKADFNPDEARDDRGRWTIGSASDAVGDAGADENFWQAVGSRLSHDARSVFAAVGRAQLTESEADLSASEAEGHALVSGIEAANRFLAEPLLDGDGNPIELPIVMPNGEMLRDYTTGLPLSRPATNADWVGPLADLIGLGAGPVLGLAGRAGATARVLDDVASSAAEGESLIGNSGFRNIGEFTDAVIANYQRFYDEHYADTTYLVSRGFVDNDPIVIGSRTDVLARVSLRNWLENVENIDEGPGLIIQVNRRLYDPAGSGAYRVPDVYIPGSKTILDGSLQFKTGSISQVRDYRAFSDEANVTIVRPAAAGSSDVAGSYGILYRGVLWRSFPSTIFTASKTT